MIFGMDELKGTWCDECRQCKGRMTQPRAEGQTSMSFVQYELYEIVVWINLWIDQHSNTILGLVSYNSQKYPTHTLMICITGLW
jgi:hypothetical protein